MVLGILGGNRDLGDLNHLFVNKERELLALMEADYKVLKEQFGTLGDAIRDLKALIRKSRKEHKLKDKTLNVIVNRIKLLEGNLLQVDHQSGEVVRTMSVELTDVHKMNELVARMHQVFLQQEQEKAKKKKKKK